MNISKVRLSRTLAAAALAAPLGAWATTAIPVPEPEMWSLLALAAVAGAIVTIRNRRK